MKKFMLFVVMLTFLVLTLGGCAYSSTTTANCAFVVGDGTYDSKVHKIIYPGESVPTDLLNNEEVKYVPCNSRNYIINDGTVVNANGEKVGDRFVLIKATTSTGVPITISARALWTLNQNPDALTSFYNVCYKYDCAGDENQSGTTNFSTTGWNGMLGENFGTAMDSAARDAAITTTDDIWKTHDPAQYEALGDAMSAVFAEKIRQNLGYSQDLFCGSGNSQWDNPDKPGEGTFSCSPVRIIIDDVQRVTVQADESTAGALSINAQRLSNAKAIYGDNAEYWLGLQDTIEICGKVGATCVFNIGGTTYTPAVVPTANP